MFILLWGSTTAEDLSALAAQMLEEAKRSCHTNGGDRQLSYNVLLSPRYLQLIPRRTEFSDSVAVNSLVR